MRNAIVVFSKVPKAGETKTRLTVDRGGIFTPEEAKDFYEASLLDVIDSCIASNCCDVYICYNRDGDGAFLKQLVSTVTGADRIKEIFPDQGGTFDSGMQYAADYILNDSKAGRLGDSVLIVGGDNPCLQPSVIQEAVNKLEKLASSERGLACAREHYHAEGAIGAGMIESIDQEGGFNLIGYTYTTPFDFSEVFYNQDGVTALDMIAFKVAEQKIPINLVEMIPDVDLPVDLASLIPMLNTLQLVQQYDSNVVLPKRTFQFLADLGIQTIAPVPQK